MAVKIIVAVLVFSALILIHEAGHYCFARLFKVGIKEFSIGMGPQLLSKTSKKTGIAYSIRAIPFGGFVSMMGEDEECDDERALNRKPAWQRLIIMAAGAAMNILLGIILVVVMVCSSKTLYGTTVLRFPDSTAQSQTTGLRTGDTILKINGKSVHIYYDMAYRIMREGGEPMTLLVLRDGERVTLDGVQFPTELESGVVYGAVDFYPSPEAKNIGTVLKHSFYESCTSIGLIWDSLFDLVSGQVGVEQVSGPVGVAQAIGESVGVSLTYFLNLVSLISLNLGIFNLLPLPALDGGRIVFLLIEMVRGKPIKAEWEGYIHFAGLAVLMLLMVIISFKDVIGLFK